MKFDGEIEISGISRVVINHLIVWERQEAICCDGQHPYIWYKTHGGSGFDFAVAAGTPRATKYPEEMKLVIDRYLEKEGVIGKWQGLDIIGKLYRVWFSSGTLNIIQKEHRIS